jgi:4-amino-4-deoxy-L-arabinose transferase-like glycosyltransferase
VLRRRELGLLVLVAAWLLVGLFGHSPWKPDEATTFGIAWSLLQGADPVVPLLAGEPQVDLPPLFATTAAAFAALLSPLLPAHDGARVASAFYMGISLVLVGAAGDLLFGRRARWLPVLLLAGSLGLWERAHHLNPDLGVLAGFALAAYGFALVERQPVWAGVALGCGIGIGFLSRGLFAPAALATTALALLALAPWRTRRYAVCLGVATAVALPWLVAWPLALHARSPELFARWLYEHNLARMFGIGEPEADRELWFYARNLPWIAWPAWPLALWTVHLRARGFGGGFTPGVQMPIVLALVTLLLLVLAPEARTVHTLPLLVPLALLGAAEVETLGRSHSAALDWFGILGWGFAAAVLWILWLQSTTTGMAPGVARLFDDAQRGFVTPLQPWSIVVSLMLTLLWFALVRPARRSNRRALLNWFAGSLLTWGLVSTLWLPYQEARRSYEPVATALRAEIPTEAACVASRGLGESQRALLHYYAGLITVREEAGGNAEIRCPFLVVQGSVSDNAALAGWTQLWEGARPRDPVERFRLYRRDSGGSASSR